MSLMSLTFWVPIINDAILFFLRILDTLPDEANVVIPLYPKLVQMIVICGW